MTSSIITHKNINKVMEKYPTKVPIVVRMTDGTIHKLLVEKSGKFDTVIHHIRSRKLLNSHQALFFFIEDRICTGQDLISELVKRTEKQYLDIRCNTESTFG